MRRLNRAACISAALAGVASASFASPARPRPVPLATSVATKNLPTCVLVHGLDSSKETFLGVAAELAAAGYPSICLDLRGHGESPLGDPDEFTPEALANDVLAAVRASRIDSAVLVGHSMGGRVAMRAAALDAASEQPLLASVIIEDMDLRERQTAVPLTTDVQRAQLAVFDEPDGRLFDTFESAKAALMPWFDGDARRVEGWRGSRIRQLPDGGWWTDINPIAQRLARDRILASDDGRAAWAELVARCKPSKNGNQAQAEDVLSVHLWYADEGERGTVCALTGDGSIEHMQEMNTACNVAFFPQAGHSIHNSARPAFMTSLKAVIDEAARRRTTAHPASGSARVRGG